MNIVVCYPVEPSHVAQIEAAAAGHTVHISSQERIAEDIFAADIFLGHARVPMPWDAVVAAGRLRWIQSSAAGLDHCLAPSVVACPTIRVSGASGLFADQVAEQTTALLLGLVRSLPTFFRAQQRREFIRRPTGDLHGKTVGIVGFGGNGRRLAEVLAPYRVRLLATDVFPVDKPEIVDSLWPAERLEDLLRESDAVVLCVPLVETTRGMIGSRQFDQVRPGSLLINVARGPVVVETDLVAALESGRLGGAGLDVTEVEPLPAASPLWDHPRVIITPHVGAQSARRLDDTTNRVCENLRRYLVGAPLMDEIDKRLGFAARQGRAAATAAG